MTYALSKKFSTINHLIEKLRKQASLIQKKRQSNKTSLRKMPLRKSKEKPIKKQLLFELQRSEFKLLQVFRIGFQASFQQGLIFLPTFFIKKKRRAKPARR